VKPGDLQQFAASGALGALDAQDAAMFEGLAARPEFRDEVRAFRETMTAAVVARVQPRVPPVGVRERLLERVRATPQRPPPPVASRGFDYVLDSPEGWQATPFEGTEVKVLASNAPENYRVVLVRLAPGTTFPRHIHAAGPEECFIVSGDLLTDGRTLGPGDYIHAPSGTDHAPVKSERGCVLLIVEPVDGAEIPTVI
jgi:quercetin dioxygenase-like cupin family protein